jgi:hypothetical protein
VALFWLSTSLTAEELRFSGMEQRLGTISKTDIAGSAIQPVAFLQDTELPPAMPVESQPPRELGEPTTGSSAEQCAAGCDCNQCCSQPIHGVYYAEAQLMWMRAHTNEGALGKLGERYELAPRFIVGYEDAGGVGGRLRFWTYGRQTPLLNGVADAVRFEFDVLDVEATSRFGHDRSEVVISGGLRWADVEIAVDGERVSSDMPGITFAADLRTIVCRDCYSEWATVAGARWSLMGGDWQGSRDGFLSPDRDDNIVVTEIYGGVEYVQHYSGYDVYARLAFEMQNWHSDVAAQTSGTDSIGFLGPGIHVGMNF